MSLGFFLGCGGESTTLTDATINDSARPDTDLDTSAPDTAVDVSTDSAANGPDVTRRETGTDATVNLDAFAGDAALTGHTESFVWWIFDVPATTPEGRAPGFNLDGYNSPITGGINCEQNQPDVTSLDGATRGIDNAFSGRVTTIDGLLTNPAFGGANRLTLSASMRAGIRTGRALILMVVRGIDGGSNDEVVVSFHQGTSTSPIPSGGLPWSDTPGLISPPSFVGGPPLAAARGTLNAGLLYVSVGSMRVPVYSTGTGANLTTVYANVQDAEISAQLLPASAGGGVANGNLGGSLAVSELLQTFATIAASPLATPANIDAFTMLRASADINPGTSGCDNISVGVTFRAQPATIVAFTQ